MAGHADIYADENSWSRPLAWSGVFHVALFGTMFLYAAVFGGYHGEDWGGSGGGGGGAMSATLVSSAIPLPAPAEQTENVLANESKGLTQSVPKAEEKPTPEAIPIPEKPTRTVSERAKPTEPPKRAALDHTVSNQIPFGQGGPVSGPYGVFSAAGAKGGFGFTGGGGDFGSRYGWYVDVVRRKVAENWLKYEIDPSISSARRVYITFEITRSGEPQNVEVEQSSGIPSLDQSAVRALQRIDTFGALPNDYSGSSVKVEFWFDYRR